ncbi:outer membrane protein transport protein [Thioclava sp. 'Guangxiensis']|uniref:outer membrane protein transport protein n=1 Tax=Thioclava sp. 'Guangxiensis' TaxID=3149044 RepID=UPI0038781744
MLAPLTLMTTCALCALSTAPVFAGGIERTAFSTGLLFEQGRVVQFELGGFRPDVSGRLSPAFGPLAGTGSGDMTTDFGLWTLGAKLPLGDRTDLMISFDHPYGADVSYPRTGSGYILEGSTATLDSSALTGVLRYRLTPAISTLAGIRVEQMTGIASLNLAPPSLPGVTLGYDVDASRETDMGYILGVAWEKPEIGARVALTYLSSITHDFDGRETYSTPYGSQTATTSWTSEIPQSVLLEAQTGIAPDTLLFGTIRWTDWSAFSVAPGLYRATAFSSDGSNLVDPIEDTVTYSLGLGHRFTESWSGAVIATYEPSSGNIVGNLGPTDGYRSLTLAATWTHEAVSSSFALRYVEIGGADTRIAGFDDNSGWGAGMRISYRF